MKLRLEATPQELESKSGDLLKAVADIIEPVNPDISEALVKALPRKETALKYPVLRELQRQTEAAYDKTIEAMLKEIGRVLDRGFEKSEDVEKSLFIGPRGGRWADAKHTIPYDEKKHGKKKAKTVEITGHPKIFGEERKITYRVVEEKNGMVKISRHKDADFGPIMPKESLKHFINDLAGKVDLPLSGRAEIDAVIKGNAEFLGKGDDGMAFRAGDKVVKVSTTVPFQPENPGHRTPDEAAKMLEGQARMGNLLADAGVNGIQRSEFVRHGDKGFQIKEWVEIPEKWTRKQLDAIQDIVIAMHKKGYALKDTVQAGLDKDGKVVLFDVGKANKQSDVPPDDLYSDVRSDMDSLSRLYRDSGEPFVRRDLDEARQAWDRVDASIKKWIDAGKFDFARHNIERAANARIKQAKATLEGEALEDELSDIDFDQKVLEHMVNRAQGVTKKSLDDELLEGGWELLDEDDGLSKALTHKYIRRVPKPGGGYRYYYRESAAARAARAGEEVRLGARMVKIVEVDEAGVVTLEEDGKQRSVKPNEWADLMATHYGDAYYAHAEKRARQAIKAVLRHVPRDMLKDLRGDTDAERLADLKARVPDVYKRLQASFQRAGVDPFKAKQIIGHALERKNWEPEARALVIGAVLTPEGARLATHHRQIVAGAENLAGGGTVQAKHVAAVIDLRVETKIEEIAKRAEEDLARLETLLSRARGKGTDARVAAVLANALAFTSESLQRLNAYSTAFPGADDRAVAPVREALLEVQGVVPKPTQEGATTSVFVAGEGGRPKALKAQYRLMEAGDVVASHSPPSFKPNEDYPADVQERAYHRDKTEQLKVLRNAKRMAAEFVVNTNPDAVNGPPIITDTGVVLGGNSRTMSMQIIYDEHPDKAEEMRKYLEDHAHEVGLVPADVAAMKNPVLVRVVEVEDTSTGNLQLLVRQMNESFTQAMDPRTMQVAMGRRLGKEALDSLANAMREDETLNAFLGSNRADAFISALYRAGIVDERNTNQYMRKGTRKLNNDGKTLVSRILVGRMIEDADLLSETKSATLSAVAQSVPAMVTATSSGEGYDLSNELRIGMDALNRLQDKVEAGTIKALDPKMSARDLKIIVDNYFSDMFGDRHPVLDNPRAQTMLEVLIRRPGPTQMSKVFREYATMAAANPERQEQLIGEKLSPEQVFRYSVQAAIDKDAAEERAVVEAERAKATEALGLFASLDPNDPDYFEKAQQLSLRLGGPFIGPRGGKWADPKHTIPWKEGKPKPKKRQAPKEKVVLKIGGLEVVNTSLAGIENVLCMQSVENVVVLDARGKVKGQAVGTETQCMIPSDLIGKISEDPDAIVTHNHPKGGCLSVEDINLAVRLDVKEIRAVVDDGAYVFTRPEGGWGKQSIEALHYFESNLRVLRNNAYQVSIMRMDARIKTAGGVPGDTNHPAFSQEVFDGFYREESFRVFNKGFEDYGWRIRKESIPTKQGGDVEAGRGVGPKPGGEVRAQEVVKADHAEDIPLSLDEAKRLASDNREQIRKAEKVQDHTKAIADHNDIAYRRVKQILVGKGYEDADFLESGPLYGWSTNQLIDLARDKRAD